MILYFIFDLSLFFVYLFVQFQKKRKGILQTFNIECIYIDVHITNNTIGMIDKIFLSNTRVNNTILQTRIIQESSFQFFH
jgi:hypothetical protein